MAFPDTAWYVNSVGYAAITARPQNTAVAAGVVRRQFTAPSVGNERAFVCIVAGTTANTTDATWTLTRGAKTTDGTATWQECTGQAAVCGDVTNTPNWNVVKNTAVTLGAIIKNVAATHYFICSTAGTAGNASEPTWGTTAGNTTADNTVTWTCIGAVGSFSGGANPHARLPNALASTWSAAGQFIYVGDNSAETSSASITLAGQSTIASPNYILCHNHAGNYPPTSSDLTTGATITSTSISGVGWTGLNIFVQGIASIGNANGQAVGIGSSGGGVQYFKNCAFTLANIGSTGTIQVGATGAQPASFVTTDNCTFSFANAAHNIRVFACRWRWLNTPSALLGTIPAVLMNSTVTVSATDVEIHGVDLSAAGSGKTLIGNANAGGYFAFVNCKLGASVTVASTPLSPCYSVDVVNCDSGATNYRNERYMYQGTLTTETTVVRTGGQNDSTTALARKIVTTSGASYIQPFEGLPIAIWNEIVGSSITLTLYGVWGGGAVPNNDDFWIDVEYPGSNASPISSKASSTKADILTTGAALLSDGSTWGGSTTPFKTNVTITPQEKGYIYVYPKVGKASSTLYYDSELLAA